MVSKPKFAMRLIAIGLGLSLATGRWGAWIGLPSQGIFVIDLLLILGIFLIVLHDGIEFGFLTFSLGLFILFQLCRNSNYALLTRIRDLLPFIYLELFLLIRRTISEVNLADLYKVLRVSSFFSLVWNLGVGLNVLHVLPSNSFAGVQIFSQRPDQAGFVACIGIIVWSKSLTKSKFERFMNFWILPLNLLSLMLQPGRAGLLALLVALPVLAIRINGVKKFRQKSLVSLLFAIIIAIPFSGVIQSFLPEKSAIKKLGILDQSGIARSSGDSTAFGRKMAQSTVLHWTQHENRLILGAGPGYEILLESGAVKWLSGNADVRYPHNWWVSLISRYGILGVTLWLICGLATIKGAFRDEAGIEFVTFLVSILIASTFGVVMESPFGIIPFAFFTSRLLK